MTHEALLIAIRAVIASVKAAYLDKTITLAEAYDIVRTVAQQAVAVAGQYAQLTGAEKRQAVTTALLELCDFLLARTKLGILSPFIRPLIQAAVPVIVDMLIELWVSRDKLRRLGQ